MDKARFMGRMAACSSHDLCNVLATIQQAAGLLADYLALARSESLKTAGIRPKFKYHDKFQEIIGQIQDQVGRGQGICECLSSLAHSPDEGQPGTDLGRAADLLADLSGRVAKSHRVTLEVAPTDARHVGKVALIEVLTALEAALLGVVFECGDGCDIRFVPGSDGADTVFVDILCQALGEGAAKSLARTLSGDKPGPFTAGVVRGGVRLAFQKAGTRS